MGKGRDSAPLREILPIVWEQRIGDLVDAQGALLQGDMNGALAPYDKDVIFELASGSGPDTPGIYRGHLGLIEAARPWMGEWRDYWIENDRLTPLDEDRLLVLFRDGGRGRTSGADVSRRLGAVLTYHGMKIVHVRQYDSQEEALDAVGLSE